MAKFVKTKCSILNVQCSIFNAETPVDDKFPLADDRCLGANGNPAAAKGFSAI